VIPGEQATVDAFNLNVVGFDNVKLLDELTLNPGKPFTREALQADIEKIRKILRESDYLAPTLDEPRVVFNSEKNTITITVNGKVGPVVEIEIDAERDRVGSRTQNRILPVKREGTLDFAAIVEGERRLETHYQEQGYFFVDVTPVCSVEPPLDTTDGTAIRNNSEFLCSALNTTDLDNRKVKLTYRIDLNRQLKLTDIRLEGASQFTITDIKTVLESQEANILGIIPLFGYGRGYTSERLLEQDAATVRSLLRELGYRDATVRVNQGVSPDGENLIITFVVEEGPRTTISGIEINGNSAFTDDELKAQLPPIENTYFSRAKIRNGQRKLAEFYSKAGYYDAKIDFAIDERVTDPTSGESRFKVVYTVVNEGQKVVIDRILVTGNDKTKTSAIMKALALKPGDFLRAADVYQSEQNLYSSDAFLRVDIKPRPAGERPGPERATDIIVSVEEQAPRILSYGGGFSTDLGASGFVDIRHFNLLGNLWQGGARVRMSQKQQLVQLDFLNPRFLPDGDRRFAPLTFTAQYQRDSTVTRFFRSAFDKGTFGIVQRVDEDGNPIDIFGADAGDPTLHRLTLSAETNRTISRRDRSIVFFRYRFEDARLYNIDSLLIKDLLKPDARIRTSGFGVTFVRDTRRNCLIKYTILDIIARGEAPDPCRYSASDPTHGDYLTADYNVSIPFLGANTGFNKFQASYNIYRTYKFLRNTTFAGRAILGLGSVFSNGDRFTNSAYPELNGSLPISERFFAGGGNSIRGFDFEEAGPRVVVVPQGIFRRQNGDQVFLDPFTIPFGGNALAVVNLEARIPLTDSVRAVPFYDGGNVFKSPKDIFNPADTVPNNVNAANLRVLWTHTIGMGLRVKTPIGGEFAVDYGYLLNPPRFLIPQVNNPPAILQLPPSQLHFRFSQAF
jgi:outer membrane protein insertion porin family